MMRSVGMALSLFVAAAGVMPAQAPKKRVAVLNFDYATVSSSVYSIFGSNTDVGKGVADLMVEKLVSSGVYSVVERKALDRILSEQNFSNSDRADAMTAAKLGRLLGVDAIVIGSITQFGRDDSSTSVGGGALSRLGGKYGLGGVGQRQSKAVVALTARMVNIDTGEILAVASGRGESTRSGTTLVGSGGAVGTAAGGGYDMTSKNFGATILGEAVKPRLVAQNGARALDQEAPRLPTRAVTVEGRVADVTGDTLILNIGTRAGVKVGDRFEVTREVRAIKDPDTGRVIRRVEDKLGQLAITEADELSAVGKFTGAGQVQVGDVAKRLP